MARDRFDHNDDHSDVTTPFRPRRIEVLSGVERRRKWPDDTKISIVTEALADGVVISDVARRHDISPQQLFGWMKRFRADALAQKASSAQVEPAMFAPVVVTTAPVPAVSSSTLPALEPASIEITFGSAAVRVRGAVDTKTLMTVLKALKALA